METHAGPESGARFGQRPDPQAIPPHDLRILRWLYFSDLPLAVAALAFWRKSPGPAAPAVAVLLVAVCIAPDLLILAWITRRSGWRWFWERRADFAFYAGALVVEHGFKVLRANGAQGDFFSWGMFFNAMYAGYLGAVWGVLFPRFRIGRRPALGACEQG